MAKREANRVALLWVPVSMFLTPAGTYRPEYHLSGHCDSRKIRIDVLECSAKTDDSIKTVNWKRHVNTTCEEIVGVMLILLLV